MIGSGGSVFSGVRSVWVDRSSVVMRSRWWCKIYGGADAGVRSGGSITLSSSLSQFDRIVEFNEWCCFDFCFVKFVY